MANNKQIKDGNGVLFTTKTTEDGSGVNTPSVIVDTISGPLPTGTNSIGTVGLNAGSNAIGSITNTSFAATQSGTWTVQPGNTANTTAWLVTGTGGTFPITAASLPLPTGAALETGGNLATISTNTGRIPTQGQSTMSASTPVAPASDFLMLTLVGQSAQTALINNILPVTAGANATNISGYRSFAIQVNSTGTGGGYIFEQSTDNTNFVPLPVYNGGLANPAIIVAAIVPTAANIIYIGSTNAPYIRLRISTAITGGSIQAYSAFSPNPLNASQQIVSQGTGTYLSTSIASGTVTTVSTVTTVTTLSQFLASAAAADATANPTTTGVRGFEQLYNSSTWDRHYNNYNTTTGDSGAKVSSFTGATQTNYNARGAIITVLCGTVTGTSPTLNAQLQWSPDAGTTWLTIGAASSNVTTTGNTITFQVYPTNFSVAGATPAALATGATTTVQLNTTLPRTWRLNYTIGGTTPSFTITGVYVNYQL